MAFMSPLLQPAGARARRTRRSHVNYLAPRLGSKRFVTTLGMRIFDDLVTRRTIANRRLRRPGDAPGADISPLGQVPVAQR